MRKRLTRLKISDRYREQAFSCASTLKLVRFPHSLAVTLHSFTFYVAHPIRSILISHFYFSLSVSGSLHRLVRRSCDCEKARHSTNVAAAIAPTISPRGRNGR